MAPMTPLSSGATRDAYKVIINPPSEITYGPLLRLFTIWKIQSILQTIDKVSDI